MDHCKMKSLTLLEKYLAGNEISSFSILSCLHSDLEGKYLNHMEFVLLVFCRISVLVCIVVVLVYIPTSSVEVSSSPPHQHLLLVDFWMMAVHSGVG